MSEDARFEDGVERALRLKAEDAEDLSVISALVQDAVLPGGEMSWDRQRRRFACLINRFRWEDEVKGRAPERVQSVLAVDDVIAVRHQGLGREVKKAVLSLMAISFEEGEDGGGRLVLTLAGDGAIGVEVEAVNVILQDVTRPYRAPSGKSPSHPE